MLTYERNGRVYSCDPTTLPEESKAYLLQYGWAQSLQDSIAGRAKKVREEYEAKRAEHAAENVESDITDEMIEDAIDQDIDGALSKRADAILNGTMGARESVSRDPFETMCGRIAREMLNGALKASKTKLDRDSDKYKQLLTQVREKHKDKIETEAKRRLEASASIEIDL